MLCFLVIPLLNLSFIKQLNSGQPISNSKTNKTSSILKQFKISSLHSDSSCKIPVDNSYYLTIYSISFIYK